MNVVDPIVRGSSALVRTAAIESTDPEEAADLIAALGDEEFAHVFLFVAHSPTFDSFVAAAAECVGGRLSGCTTAGEISPSGYLDQGAVAIALSASHFAVRSVAIPDLDNLDGDAIVNALLDARYALSAEFPEWTSEFGLSICDGLSTQSENLLLQMAPGLASLPFVGGSAGDALAFENTPVALGSQCWSNGAVISVVRSRCPIKVFSLDHFRPTETRMIVTSATPRDRLVHEINGAPATIEYARMLGLDEADLSNSVFAAHPMVVRMGAKHYVRSILRIAPESSLEMACAIDEGVVLSLAEAAEISSHLADELGRLDQGLKPEVVLAFDCLWRRIDVEEWQLSAQVSKILSENRVVGFSTYGEQINRMHVNQTMTGVALYPCDPTDA